MYSRRPGHRFNRGRVATAAGAATGVSELIESLTLATDAYAESIANTSILRGGSLVTKPTTGDQFFAYHADNLPSVLSGKVALGKITPANVVTTSKSAILTDAQDSHNFFSMVVDGDDDLLMAGDMHGVPMKWQRLAGGSITFTGWATPPIEPGATDETSVTYPIFAIRLSTGDAVFAYRDGASGDGKYIFKKWTKATNALALIALIVDGTVDGKSFYPDVPYWDEARGRLHCGGCWRDTTNLNTNHDRIHFYLTSADNWNTVSAFKADGSAQTLPVTVANAAYAAHDATNTGLTNVGTITVDSSGYPHMFSFTDPGDGIAQVFADRWTGSAWERKWIPDDPQLQSGTPFSYVGVTSGAYRTISSPYAICDGVTDRTIILMRSDTQGAGVWAMICERADLTQWVWKQISADDLGNAWFGGKDEYLWRTQGTIDMLVQKSQLKDYGTEPDIGPQTLKRERFRPKSAAYTYTAPASLWDPDTLAGCVAYVAPRGGVKSSGSLNGVKVKGGGVLADVGRVTALMDARDASPFVVQATTSDAPNLVWNRYGARKGGVFHVAANADYTQGNDAPTLAAMNGVNIPFVAIFVVEFTTVAASQRVISFGDSAGANTKYMAVGITAAGLPTFERRVAGAIASQYTGNGTTPIVAGTPCVIAAVFDGTNGYMLVNKVQQGAAIAMGFATASTWTHYNTGRRNRATVGDLYLDGYHGAIWVGNAAVSLANVQAACTSIAAEHGFVI